MSIAEEKRPKPAESPRQTPLVIGIGASAGGLRRCSSSSTICRLTAA